MKTSALAKKEREAYGDTLAAALAEKRINAQIFKNTGIYVSSGLIRTAIEWGCAVMAAKKAKNKYVTIASGFVVLDGFVNAAITIKKVGMITKGGEQAKALYAK
jgi:hypothetical protein